MSDLLFNENAADLAAPAAGKVKSYVLSSDRILRLIDSKGVISLLAAAALPNWLGNSGFWFAQRQAPGSATTYAADGTRKITADRWGVSGENNNATYQRIDSSASVETGLQGRYYGTFLKTTSTGKLVVSQIIEGGDTCALRGRTVRVQGWIKSSTGTPIVNIALVQNANAGTIDAPTGTWITAFGANATDPTLGANLAYIAPKSGVTPDNATTDGNHAECTTSTSWARFGAVFDVPSNAKNLLVVFYGDSQFVATAGFSLAQVSLTDGYEVQNWTPLSYDVELGRVQRFYCKTFNIDTLPAASAGAATGEARIPAPVTASTAWPANWTWEFPVRMRAAPTTLTLYNPAAAGAQVRNQTLNTDCTLSTVTADGECRCVIAGTTPASTVVGTNILGVHISADAEL